ncbi:MAG: phosphate transport system protein [Halanaerobium sp. 4-GBenrich]|jgi:phosphate transport system protein|uniref:Phosphate-specific transport system accessory protein PhoU n=1 Tax=Halanaerobium congolense TaxID=54121 RepID=A0A1G6LNJ4_9FIRM|nr:phosphate signaling complex protein PhoU [Halanaerobium congolense]KXS49734.1 MAG: phosphate transport system protein [Halanaerobium sp. T82-1]ODS50312.1 MAG: phosphate transport system protein [Halanaerobium sp. 4-GBenrich]OEG63319.1 MAG: phosphate transport system regulatory protein PhoU [Halanaerobium sp. MDAL1]PUU93116.1 MAG: phosphate transport system protein [Halanaerobium sp.]PTX15651.1 PhoU-like phosphate uptake regulator [Halanaerobium congolense]
MNDSRKSFHTELKSLEKEMLKMGSFVGESISQSIEALINKDLKLADEVIKNDDIIDNYELNIEEKCTRLIALQQPVAIDLRKIIVISKLVTDLERIGDNASNIAYKVKEIGAQPLIKEMQDLPKMRDIVVKMLRDSLEAFVNMDIVKAKEIAARDEEIDNLDEQINFELLEVMKKNRETIKQGTSLLFISRFLERIGDHSTNICERTVYMKTGKWTELE